MLQTPPHVNLCGGQTVKKPGRAREGPQALSRFNRIRAVSVPGNAQHFRGNCEGWKWRGSLLPRPPACLTSKGGRPGVIPTTRLAYGEAPGQARIQRSAGEGGSAMRVQGALCITNGGGAISSAIHFSYQPSVVSAVSPSAVSPSAASPSAASPSVGSAGTKGTTEPP